MDSHALAAVALQLSLELITQQATIVLPIASHRPATLGLPDTPLPQIDLAALSTARNTVHRSASLGAHIGRHTRCGTHLEKVQKQEPAKLAE